MKLSMIINKRDPYHLFLQNFSYSHMLQKVKSFIDLILSKDPPFFLQKAAARVSKIKIAQGMVLEPSDSGESLERTQVKREEESRGSGPQNGLLLKPLFDEDDIDSEENIFLKRRIRRKATTQ
ncbi:telomeric repeat-binding factor 1 [Latimeria chalumnae]|uniref:telomeric repeat-binding factor 1 n=1 Tax=Latimeria chalumnae TaxID=7897 RepID=UPI00313DAEE7